jgi:choline kinase
MKCLIIAAGQGSRLRTLAPSKPLALVKGVPLLEYVVRGAHAGGASEFLVVTGYEAEGIEAFLPGLSGRVGAPVKAIRNPDWLRPNGLSVLAAAGELDGEFLLMMSDHLFEPQIVRTLLAAPREGRGLTLAVDRKLDSPILDMDDATKVETAPDGRIARIGKQIERFDAIDTGIFLGTPALLAALRDCVEAGGTGSLSEGVQALARDKRAFVHDIGQDWWIDVDDAAAFERAERTMPPGLAA